MLLFLSILFTLILKIITSDHFRTCEGKKDSLFIEQKELSKVSIAEVKVLD